MSKCDLAIVFDRSDRQFEPGDEVTGTVHVQVNQEVECKGILLEHFWQTHGRGNTATGPKQTSVLYRGTLQAGESLSYPFRFTAPNGPPTYHGRYLNVDHYVHVRVDIPWAIDPKLKEDYVLLPGTARYGNLPGLATRGLTGRQAAQGCGLLVGVGLMIAGVLFFPFGIVLIGVGLVVLFFALRKAIAERKVGKVKMGFDSTTVAPGGRVAMRLAFTPAQSGRLNRILAELVGKERCVSGSGTNKTTHTHKLHERTFMLISESELVAGRPVVVEGAVPIPETTAYSFHASNNDVIWELQVRIDIPFWPDWIEKRPVIVRPPVEPKLVEATVVQEAPARQSAAAPVFPVLEASPGVEPPRAAQPEPSAAEQPEPVGPPPPGAAAEPLPPDAPAEASPEPAPEQPPEPAAPETAKSVETDFAELETAELETTELEYGEPETAEQESPAEPSPTGTDPALVSIVGRIAAADRYGREREQIIEESAETPFDCQIEITRKERTYSYIPDKRFRQGRTVTGKLQGTDCEVAVQLVASRNDEIDALERGSRLRAECKPLKWNSIYDRLEMREA